MRKAIATIGVFLLVLSAIGEVHRPTLNPPTRQGEKFDAQLAESTRSLSSLKGAAKGKSPDEMFDLVIRRFAHGERGYGITENWILFFLGLAHSALGHMRDPDQLLKRRAVAWCGEQSYVLMHLMDAAGIRSRHVGLNGHVVMEAWLDGDWRMYDPDFEVKSSLGVEDLSKRPDILRTMYRDDVVGIFTSREDNTFMSYPRLAQFEWKSNALLWWERIANWLKWIIPAFLVVPALTRRRG